MIKDSGERTAFETGAVRDMHEGKGRMDLLPWRAIMAVSKHCEAGAEKYGEHNVDKGIPVSSLFDSGVRHAAKWWLGIEDEDHLLAACWNFLWALEMMLKKPEMDNRYRDDAPAELKPEAPKKTPAAKKPMQPGTFSGYGAKLKKQVFEKLQQMRADGVTLAQLSAITGGKLTNDDILAMLQSKKVDYSKWELMANALMDVEAQVPTATGSGVTVLG